MYSFSPMGEIITLGGDRIDPSDKLQRLIAENAVYVDAMPTSVWSADTDFELTTADEHTSAWLSAIGKSTQETEKLLERKKIVE